MALVASHRSASQELRALSANKRHPRCVLGVVMVMSLLARSGSTEAHPAPSERIHTLSHRISDQPGDAALLLERGQLHHRAGLWEAALRDYDRAAKLDPGLEIVNLLRARAYLSAGRPAMAFPYADIFVGQHPDHALGRMVHARTLASLNRLPQAIESYARAMRQLPTRHPEHYLEYARLLASWGRASVSSAEHRQQQRRSTGPSVPSCWYAIEITLARAHIDRAIGVLDRGIEELGPIVSLQTAAIELELAQNRSEAALLRLDRIMKRARRQERWLARKGEILEQAEEVAAAQQAYTAALVAIRALPARHRTVPATQSLELSVRKALERLPAEGTQKIAQKQDPNEP